MVPALLTRMSIGADVGFEPAGQGPHGGPVGEVDAVAAERATAAPRPVAPPRCRTPRASALTPMMSAPAVARAPGHRQADAAPAPGHHRHPAGQIEQVAHRLTHRPTLWQSTSTFTSPPRSSASNASFTRPMGTTRVIRTSAGTLPAGDQVDGALHVLALVDARSDDGQLAPEQAEQVDLARHGVDRDHHQAATGRQHVGRHAERRRPTRKPRRRRPLRPRRSTRPRPRPRPRPMDPPPSGRAAGPPPGAGRPARARGRRRHRSPRPAPRAVRSVRRPRRRPSPPGRCRPAGRRARPRRSVRRARPARSGSPGGSRASRRAGTVQELCSEPGESMPTKLRLWQMWWWPARQAGQSPHHSSGTTVTGSPADQPDTPCPTSAMRPAISCPMTAGSAHPLVHGAVADVQVGAADAGVGDVDAHLAPARAVAPRPPPP